MELHVRQKAHSLEVSISAKEQIGGKQEVAWGSGGLRTESEVTWLLRTKHLFLALAVFCSSQVSPIP